jgi:hypothetical protein
MPGLSRRFAKPADYFKLRRAGQISESHCGPAVIQMLLSNLGVDVTQELVAEAGGATHLLELHGMRVDQLAKAVCQLVPAAQFWYKHHASLADLIALITEHLYPVGVEWQGFFEDEDEDEDEDDEDDEDEDDYGHYSVITHIDQEKQELIIVDPYKTFVERDHILGFDEFVERWWDFNEITSPKTGRTRYVKDTRMMFIVTPKDALFPKTLAMKRARCVRQAHSSSGYIPPE